MSTGFRWARFAENVKGGFTVDWRPDVFRGVVWPSENDQAWPFDSPFEEYLRYESASSGESVERLREREGNAQKEVGRLAPSQDKLRILAERSTPPAKYLEGDESSPF
ncbi:MAG TPA: hypothetical protein VNH11_27375 [Pirellulales bacterium]|nr:hypothetical protein [Pirellulales bacterium]